MPPESAEETARLEPARQVVTTIARKIEVRGEADLIAMQAKMHYPMFWERSRRKAFAEGYRKAIAQSSNDAWHAMP